MFLSYVGAGYFFSLSTSYPTWGAGAIAVASAIVCLLVYLTLAHTGRAIAAARASADRRFIVALLGLTFILSAYGVFTASMLIVEGPDIVREDISHTRDSFSRLEAGASAVLRVPAVEDLTARVNSWKGTLLAEIDNPVYCGVGPRAVDAITELQKDLPSLTVLNGSDRKFNCKTDRPLLEQLKRIYSEKIDDALRHHPSQVQYRTAERSEVLRHVNETTRTEQTRLDRLADRLVGVSHFAFRLQLFHDCVATLQQSKSAYDQLYQQIAGIAALDPSIPSHLDDQSVEQIVSTIHVWGTVSNRLNHWTTYFYFFGSLLADCLAALLLANAIHVARRRNAVRDRLARTEKGVRYLLPPIEEDSELVIIRNSR